MSSFLQPATVFGWVMVAIDAAAFVAALFGLVDAAVRRSVMFRVVGRGTKALWVAILATAMLISIFTPGVLGILGIAGLVASIVYLVDVRPKLRALGGGGSRRGTNGPYGPW